MRGLAFLFALVLALPAWAQELPALFRVTGVAADDVLNIRAEPNAGAEKLAELAPDARDVEVVEISDGWGRINVQEFTGWVSMRFMAHQGEPAWHTLSRPLTCYGTEPFWNMTIPTGGDIAYNQMEFGASTLTRTGESAGFGDPATKAIAIRTDGQTGTILIQAGQCSDGMSDREMGLTFDMILYEGWQRGTVTGCCSLSE